MSSSPGDDDYNDDHNERWRNEKTLIKAIMIMMEENKRGVKIMLMMMMLIMRDGERR